MNLAEVPNDTLYQMHQTLDRGVKDARRDMLVIHEEITRRELADFKPAARNLAQVTQQDNEDFTGVPIEQLKHWFKRIGKTLKDKGEDL